jgi:hypothetical protein
METFQMVCNSSGSIIGPAGIVVEESRKAFAPGELASPERGFENQKGTVKSKRYRRACPAGAIFEGRGRPRKHRSTRASRVVAGAAWFHVLVSKLRSGGARELLI